MIFEFYNKIKRVVGLFEEYKLQFFFIVVVILFISFLEMISVGMVLPILDSVVNEKHGSFINNNLSFVLKIFPKEHWTLIIISLLVFASLLTVFSKIFVTYYSQKVIQSLQLKWRLKLLEKYLSSVYEFVLRFKQGDIIHNINVEANQAAKILTTIVQWVTSLFIGISVYLLLLFSSFYITIIMSVIITIIFYVVKYLGENYQQKISTRLIRLSQNMNSLTAEAIISLQQIKLFSLENLFWQKYKETGVKRNRDFVLRSTLQIIPSNITYLVMPFVLLVFYLYFLLFSNQNFNEFIPELGLIFVGFTRISASLMQVVQQRMMIYNFLPSLYHVEKILETNVEKENVLDGKHFDKLKSDIILENVSFSYIKNNPIISNLNLKIPKGKMTAIIGPSGSGKTTISYLLTGLYSPQSGQIKINGQSLKNYNLESWRKKIGYVTQDTFIFNMSVKENILLGNRNATEEELLRAAEAAHCNEFIDRLPQKWDTIVGERGMKLSGGQRQRIAIARAMVRNPELYIFDEATSALDNHSEKLIQSSIEKISKNSTIIVIAHRLTTIEKADIVYDLGEIETKVN